VASKKKIDNPAYKGPWVHPQIDNPEYQDDPELYAFDSFKYLGIDVWQVKSGTIFSHFLLTDDWDTAKAEIDVINTIREGEKAKKDAEAAARAAEEKPVSEEPALPNEEHEDL